MRVPLHPSQQPSPAPQPLPQPSPISSETPVVSSPQPAPVAFEEPPQPSQAATLQDLAYVPTTKEPALPVPSSEDSTSESLALLENILSEVENKRAQNTQSVDLENFSDQQAAEPPLATVPFEQASMDATGLLSQVANQVVQESVSQQVQQINPLNPTGIVSQGGKEAVGSVSLEQIAIDAARGAQQVELEPTPEIPPEVESYLQKVEDNTNLAPPEVVIADGSQTSPVNHAYPAQPVIVLPITPEEEAQGARKSPRFSIRWLVEWSRKIMKVFSGKVIYRMPEENA